MIIKKVFFFILFLMATILVSGQNALVQGVIEGEDGEPLSFANIYIPESGKGTYSGEEGRFQIEVPAGRTEIIIQYVGYQQVNRSVNSRPGDTVVLEISMQPTPMELKEVVIAGDRNPAEEVMRNAIARRQEHLMASSDYECEVYIKGMYRLIDAPDHFMGMETGGYDSLLAEMNVPTNIIYLSETRSVYGRSEGKMKERVLASKTAGAQQFPSINQAQLIDINFYESEPRLFGRNTKSPLARNAFQHYHFSLVGVYAGANNEEIYRIKMVPKRTNDPLYSGYLDIHYGKWTIHGVNAWLTGKRLNLEIADTLELRQTYYTEGKREVPPVIQTDLELQLSAFGFEVAGGFTGTFENHQYVRDSFSLDFGKVALEYEQDAYAKDSIYWEGKRPTALNAEEKVDYEFKDSIATVLGSDEFKDSVDRAMNQFEANNLYTGYTYRKRSKGIQWSIKSPLMSILFNPVQGFHGSLGGTFRKEWEGKKQASSLELDGNAGFGVSDEVWRGWGSAEWKLGRDFPLSLQIAGGYQLAQLHRRDPISRNANSWSNFYFKTHYIRFYDSRNLNFSISKQIPGGIRLRQSVRWDQRSLVENTSQYSLRLKRKRFPENIPGHIDIENQENIWIENDVLLLEGEFSYRPGARFYKFPDRTMEIPGDWPTFSLNYSWGLPAASSHSDFLRLEMGVDYRKEMGISGYSNWNFNAGTYLRNNRITFFDYKHFSGNTFWISDGNYSSSFLTLPFYEFSTSSHYLEGHWLHNFRGRILNLVPGVRELGFALEPKAGYLYTDHMGHYNEFSLGLDRLGWGIFRIFRLDGVVSMLNGQYHDWRLIFGVKVNFQNLLEMSQ